MLDRSPDPPLSRPPSAALWRETIDEEPASGLPNGVSKKPLASSYDSIVSVLTVLRVELRAESPLAPSAVVPDPDREGTNSGGV